MDKDTNRRLVNLVNCEELTGWQIHILCEAEYFENRVYITEFYSRRRNKMLKIYSHNGNAMKALIKRGLLKVLNKKSSNSGYFEYTYYAINHKENKQ